MAQNDPQAEPQGQQQAGAAMDPVMKKLLELGPEFQMGFDVPRHFSTGSQVFAGGELTLIVFREQNAMVGLDGQPDVLIRNMTSVVMQTSTAKQLRDMLVSTFEQLEAKVVLQPSSPGPALRFKIIPAAAMAGAATFFGGTHYTADPVSPPTQSPPTTGATTFIDQRLLDATLEAVEARTETKFVQLLGKMDGLSVTLAHVSTQVKEAKDAAASGKTYVIATGIAIGGFIVAVFAFGAQIMDVAMAISGHK